MKARPFVASALATLAFVAGTCTIPYAWCRRGADEWYRGDLRVQQQLAEGVMASVVNGIKLEDFHTGSSQFNGEWLFGTYFSAALGFGQLAIEHPGTRDANVQRMATCIRAMLRDEVREFDRTMWRGDPIEAIGSEDDHAAFMGYLNVVLGLHRLLDASSEFAGLNDRISDHLEKRMLASPGLLLESYPGEVYLVDNCAVIASIALRAKATGLDRRDLVQGWTALCRARYRDPKSGLLYQAYSPGSETPSDLGRGSGTALGLYLLGFADKDLSRELYGSVRARLAGRFLHFGAVREYPRGVKDAGDIDSGPIIMGFGLSPTGFTLAGARMFHDPDYFRALFASAHLCGAPLDRRSRRDYVVGGPLGNAILFAMFTALPEELLP